MLGLDRYLVEVSPTTSFPPEKILLVSMLTNAMFSVTGGVLQVGRGIGKGITQGDGRAVVDGLSKGATSVGGGFAQGAESAVMGAADGVLSAGKGMFSGVKSVGKGLGGAFKGKKPNRRQSDH